MGRKRCVTNFNGNYDNKSKEKVFRLPADMNEKAQWLRVIPRELEFCINCENHIVRWA